MHDVDISGVDLNLLVALDALLAEAHVTRAARRVGLSQPAMSHALSRLRELFDDPLLVRAGRGMVPTPRAEALRGPLARVLGDIGRLVRETGAFDPATSTRAFRMLCPDLLSPALPDLLSAMSVEAPRVRLEVRPLGPGMDLGAADLALSRPQAEGPGLTTRTLGQLTWAVLARRDHPARRRFGRDAWLRYPHVQVATGSGSASVVDAALARARMERRIGVTVPGFLVAPEVVARTDFFFTAPRELIAPVAERHDLALLRPPIAIDPIPVVALWHERVHADPAHVWFRSVVTRVVTSALRPRRQRSKG